jgi:hypothetical protein
VLVTAESNSDHRFHPEIHGDLVGHIYIYYYIDRNYIGERARERERYIYIYRIYKLDWGFMVIILDYIILDYIM